MTSARDTWRFRRSKALWLGDVLRVVGLGVFVGLTWQIGLQQILVYLQRLGWRCILVFLPYLLVFICDGFGWRYAFTEPPPLGFLRLPALQIIGKAANIITPLASVGGDPLKAYLLQTAGVRFSAGLASVVIARTMATIAQGIFVLGITVVTFFSLGLPWQLVQAVAMAFSTLRRMRELGWAAIGFLLLSRFNSERPLRRTSASAAAFPDSTADSSNGGASAIHAEREGCKGWQIAAVAVGSYTLVNANRPC